MKLLKTFGRYIRRILGFEPTPTQIRLIRALRDNPNIMDGDITVTPRGGIKRSVESAIRSKSFRQAVIRASQRTERAKNENR